MSYKYYYLTGFGQIKFFLVPKKSSVIHIFWIRSFTMKHCYRHFLQQQKSPTEFCFPRPFLRPKRREFVAKWEFVVVVKVRSRPRLAREGQTCRYHCDEHCSQYFVGHFPRHRQFLLRLLHEFVAATNSSLMTSHS